MSQSVGSIHYDLSLKTAQFDAAVAKTNAQVSTMGEKFSAAGATMMKIGGAMTLASAAVVFTGAKFVSLAGDLQTTQQRMEALTGSSTEAKRIMGELYTYVLGKPIAFPDASKAAQVLMGYGVQSSKVVDSMKTLSAFSIVNGADMSQLALAYGQVNAKGHLMGQEIIQLTNNFVPVSQVIAKHFNVSVQEAMQLMEDGKVSAQDFNAAMAGFIPQEKIEAMSNTFKNRMISLQGSVRSFGLALLGVKMDKELGLVVEKGGVFDMLSNLLPKIAAQLSKVGKWFKELSPFGKQLAITFAAIFIAAGPVLLVLGSMAAAVGAIVALGAPVLLVIAAIVAIGAALVYLQVRFGFITKAMEWLKQAITPLVTMFQANVLPVLKMVADFLMGQAMVAWNQLKDAFERVKATLEPFYPQLRMLAIIIGVVLVTPVVIFIAVLAGLVAAFVFVITIVARVIAYFMNLWAVCVSVVYGIINAVANLIAWFNNLYQNAVGVVNGVTGAFNNLRNNIWAAVSGFGSMLVGAGQALVNGLAQGIRNAAGGPINAIKDVVNRVRNYLPFSPAKEGPFSGKGWTPYSGQAMMEGLAQGINRAADIPRSAINNALQGSLQAAQVQVNPAIGQAPQAQPINIYGNIEIGDKQTADYFFTRLNRGQDLSSMGLAG